MRLVSFRSTPSNGEKLSQSRLSTSAVAIQGCIVCVEEIARCRIDKERHCGERRIGRPKRPAGIAGQDAAPVESPSPGREARIVQPRDMIIGVGISKAECRVGIRFTENVRNAPAVAAYHGVILGFGRRYLLLPCIPLTVQRRVDPGGTQKDRRNDPQDLHQPFLS